MNWMEWIGYAASAFILLSMLMTSIVRLRLINLAGCALFVAYGLLIKAYPVALMNFLIAVVNIYHIVKILSARKEYFSILETSPLSKYTREFVRFYKKDIQRFMPDFNPEKIDPTECFLLLKNMNVAGVFMGKPIDDHTLKIELDYILKPYRDFKPGNFLYHSNKQLFLGKGYHKLLADPENKTHNHYLEKMGFTYRNGKYENNLA